VPDELFRFLQAFASVAVFFGAYLLWIRPRQSGLGLQALGLLLLVDLTLMGGLIGGAFWWVNEPGSFGWRLPPLAARLLAAAAWAYAAGAIVTLMRPTRDRLRLMMILLVVYLGPLALSIVAFHLGRFDPSALITYLFFLAVLSMLPSAVWWLIRPPNTAAIDESEPVRTGGLTRTWFIVSAAALALWGLALFVTDAGPSTLVWVWPGDPLSSQLIGVMLLTVAAGALYGLRSAEVAQVTLVLMLVYGLGVVAGTISLAAIGAPLRPAYLVVFALVAAISGALLFTKQVGAVSPIRRRFP